LRGCGVKSGKAGTRSVWSSHELPSSEGRKILRGEFKPLAIPTAIVKTPVPVLLDAYGVVGLDRVDDLRRLGQLDDKLSFATAQCIRSADLEEAAGLHQVDIAQFARGGLLRNSLCLFGIAGPGRYSRELREVNVLSAPAEPFEFRRERSHTAELSEGAMARKPPITPMLEPDFAFYRKMAKLSHEGGKVAQQVLARSGRGELVWLKTLLSQGIAPSSPILPMPVRLLKACLMKEALKAKRSASICGRRSANL